MKFSAIFAVASILVTVIAAPAALPVDVTTTSAISTVTVVPDAAPPVNINATEPIHELEERANNGANCVYSPDFGYNTYKIITWGPWAQDRSYGRGLLDNMRGQCGVITDWQFYYRADRAGVAKFKTTIFCTPKRAQDAIWLASGPKNVGIRCNIGRP
ncbi:hypothetical protein TWF281_002282 [Arthrobotrys megalospora]